MNKKLLTIVGVAAVVGIGYYLLKSSKPKDTTTPTKNIHKIINKKFTKK